MGKKSILFNIGIWVTIIWCGAGILFCIKEITKIVFEGLTTW